MKKFDEFLNERKISEKQASRFEAEVKEIVERYGGVVDSKYEWQTAWTIETTLGELRISLHDNAGSEVYSIFLKFSEPERSKHLDSINPHSGKWNVHHYKIDWATMELEDKLEEVELKQLEPVQAEVQMEH